MPGTEEDVEAFKNLVEAELKKAEVRGAARERAQVVKWCRTVLRLNRNAQDFANDVERGAHWEELNFDLPG